MARYFAAALAVLGLGCARDATPDARPARHEPDGENGDAAATQRDAAVTGVADGDAAVMDMAPDAAVTGDAGRALDDAAHDAVVPDKHGLFYCFGWVHGPQFSTDCHHQRSECERQRLEMKRGARDVLPECSEVRGAWCTRVARKAPQFGDERCFGSAHNCAVYRSYVEGNGLNTTECVEK